MNQVRKRLLLISVPLLFIIGAGSGKSQTSVTKVQSLYLYNFAKYIKWNNVSDRMNIGIYASEREYNEIARILSNRKVGTTAIDVSRLERPEQATDMHIVFVSQSYNWVFKKVVAGDTKNMLLVTEFDQIRRGASISFVLRNSKLTFKINEESCTKAGLMVSNNLISLGV